MDLQAVYKLYTNLQQCPWALKIIVNICKTLMFTTETIQCGQLHK